MLIFRPSSSSDNVRADSRSSERRIGGIFVRLLAERVQAAVCTLLFESTGVRIIGIKNINICKSCLFHPTAVSQGLPRVF